MRCRIVSGVIARTFSEKLPPEASVPQNNPRPLNNDLPTVDTRVLLASLLFCIAPP
jgi:hypothetical protein